MPALYFTFLDEMIKLIKYLYKYTCIRIAYFMKNHYVITVLAAHCAKSIFKFTLESANASYKLYV